MADLAIIIPVLNERDNVAPLIARLGVRTTAFFTVLGIAAIFALIPLFGSAPFVFACFFCAGLLGGALEINLNVEIDRIEAQE